MFDAVSEMTQINIRAIEALGWTLKANLAYRHVLHDYFLDKSISCERIQQIAMQYECTESDLDRIEQGLRDAIEVAIIFRDAFDAVRDRGIE